MSTPKKKRNTPGLPVLGDVLRLWLFLEGDEFRREFELLENVRNSNLNDYKRTLNGTKYLSNHPGSLAK